MYVMSVSHNWLCSVGLKILRLDVLIMSFFIFCGSFQSIFRYICCTFLRLVDTLISREICAVILLVPYVERLDAICCILWVTLASMGITLNFFGVMPSVFGYPAILQRLVQAYVFDGLTDCFCLHCFAPSKVFLKCRWPR